MRISFFQKIVVLNWILIFSAVAMEQPSSDLSKLTEQQLQEYAEKSGEYKLFKTTQKIYDIIHEVAQDRVRSKSIDLFKDSKKCWSSPNGTRNQTENGLFMRMGPYCPQSLCTPWGDFTLHGGCGGNVLGMLSMTQAILKRIKVSLDCLPELTKNDLKYYYPPGYKLTYYEVSDIDQTAADLLSDGKEFEEYRNKVLKKIPDEKLESYLNTDTLVSISSFEYCTWYKVVSVDNEPLPDAKVRSPYRDSKIMEVLWKIMDKRYQQEKALAKN